MTGQVAGSQVTPKLYYRGSADDEVWDAVLDKTMLSGKMSWMAKLALIQVVLDLLG